MTVAATEHQFRKRQRDPIFIAETRRLHQFLCGVLKIEGVAHVLVALEARPRRGVAQKQELARVALDGDVLPKDNRLEQTLRVIELAPHQLVKGR